LGVRLYLRLHRAAAKDKGGGPSDRSTEKIPALQFGLPDFQYE
jgi:hypothetical protein